MCGFRKDQEFIIDANETHKAYYLFHNPESKAVFGSGLAIKGSDIQRIEPDYNATMGWNQGNFLTPDDWAEVTESGIVPKLRDIMSSAKEIARIGNIDDMQSPLITLVRGKYKELPPCRPLVPLPVLPEKNEDKK